MAKVLILYVEAGHGHRKVAEAVGKELRARNVPGLHVEVSNALEKTRSLFRKSYPVVYHRLVVWIPWLWGFFYYLTDLAFIYSLLAPLRSLWNWFQSEKLRNYLETEQFDIILFTHFFPAEVAATVKRKGLITAKLITIVTDVMPHSVWQNPGTDFYWVMAEESSNILLKHSVSKNQIYAKGIPVSSEFLKEERVASLKNKFGLQPNRLTILFTSGSFGIGPTEVALDSFENLGDQVQALVICGKNKVLFATLSHRHFSFPVVLFGFVDNMHEMMSVADILIAKSGGATMCESLVKKLPMIITSPIPGQESYNAKWLLNYKAAFQIKNPIEIKSVISKITNQPDLLKATRQSIESIAKPHATNDLANFVLEELKK